MDSNNIDFELSEKEQLILATLFAIESNPKDEETNAYILDGNRRILLNLSGIQAVIQPHISEDIPSSYLESLIEKKFLTVKNDFYSLTEEGTALGKKIRGKFVAKIYDNQLITCAKSEAYNKFCEQVYGKNLLQFNVVDFQQLDLMLEKLKIKSNEAVLDLGCGLGKITEYLAEKTNAHFTAIDLSQKAIEWANEHTNVSEKLKFEAMDINELTYPPNSFDVIIALDVIYWIKDLTPVIKKLKDILKPNGRMGFFYVQFQNPKNPKEVLTPENTILAKLLKQNDFDYEVIDVSQIAVELWKRKLEVGKELRPQFLEEGNQDIIDERISSGESVLEKFKNKEQKRYFFYVKKN